MFDVALAALTLLNSGYAAAAWEPTEAEANGWEEESPADQAPDAAADEPEGGSAHASAPDESQPTPGRADSNAIPRRYNQWSIDVAPGGSFVFGGAWNAYGGGFRIQPWNHGRSGSS